MRGDISSSEMQYIIGGLLLVALTIVVVLGGVDPIQSNEFRSLELSNIIAADINSLSAQKEKSGLIEIERKKDFGVKISYEKGDGYFVSVVMYDGDDETGAIKTHILSYPSFKDDKLENSIEKVKKICIQKRVEDELAKVINCE